jgi:hypothetical protein
MAGGVWNAVGKLRSFWFFIVGLAAIGVGTAIYAYRLSFGGGLSSEVADWSAFGSYAGGVFGPLISFLTLLAVLKTVYLQRELLDNQSAEFIKLDANQKASAEKQDAQLVIAKEELDLARAQAYLTTQLQLVETLIEHYRREADGLGDALKMIVDEVGYSGKTIEATKEPLEKKHVAEQKIADLIALSLELSVFEYSSVEEIRKTAGVKILKVMYGAVLAFGQDCP